MRHGRRKIRTAPRLRRRRAVRRTGRKLLRRVRGIVARMADKKFNYLYFGTGPAATTGTVLQNNPYLYISPVSGLTPGGGASQYNGTAIFLRYTKTNFVIWNNSGSAVALGYRILVGFFRQANYNNTNIFIKATADNVANASNWLAPIDTEKFIVIKDRIKTLGIAAGDDTPKWRILRMTIKWMQRILIRANNNVIGSDEITPIPAIIMIPQTTDANDAYRMRFAGYCMSSYQDI